MNQPLLGPFVWVGWGLAWAWAAAAAAAVDFSLVPGVVIDHSPASSGLYVGSPGLAILPDGRYVASHDEFGPSSTYRSSARTRVFRSADRGASWSPVATFTNAFWGTLFVHRGDLYWLGVTMEYGRIAIRRSSDGGATWTEPAGPEDGFLTASNGYHCAPMPVLEHNGRLWRAFEYNPAPYQWAGVFEPMVISAAVTSDLLRAESWTLSGRIPRDAAWLPGGGFLGWLEGNAVVDPQGGLCDILRVDVPAGAPEKAAIVRVDETNQTVSMSPADVVDFPGGAKKFAIRFDPVSKLYWSLATAVTPPHDLAGTAKPGKIRNTLVLLSSPDLRSWTRRTVLLYHPDTAKHGFQYVEWLFDGDDIVAACRTAYDDGLGGAHNNHDANFLTFHRIPMFRQVQGPGGRRVLLADTLHDRVVAYRVRAPDRWVPDRTFAEGTVDGQPLQAPRCLAADGGAIYLGEARDGGRILRFAHDGTFLATLAVEGAAFRGRPDNLTVGPDSNLYLSVAFGTNSDRIYRLDPNTGAASVFVATTGSGYSLSDPRGLAFGSDGRLYVADRNNNAVRIFSGATGAFVSNLASVTRPQALAWDEAGGRLLVSAESTPVIYAYTLAGARSTVCAPGYASEIVLDVARVGTNLAFTRYGGDAAELVRSPTQSTAIAAGLDGPGQILVLPPEPGPAPAVSLNRARDTLSWTSEPGAVYDIESSLDLGAWTTLLADEPPGGATEEVTVRPDLPPAGDAAFLRVVSAGYGGFAASGPVRMDFRR